MRIFGLVVCAGLSLTVGCGSSGSAGASAAGATAMAGSANGGSGSSVGGSGNSGGAPAAKCSSGPSLFDVLSAPAPAGNGPARIEGEYGFIRAVEGIPGKVFVLWDGGILEFDNGSLTPKELLKGSTGAALTSFSHADGMLRATDTHLYWATGKGVSRMPIAGGPIEVVYDGIPAATANGDSAPDLMQLSDGFVYYFVRETNTLWRVAITGGEPQALATTLDLVSFAVQNGTIYVSNADSNRERLMQLPAAGGDSKPFFTPDDFGTYLGALTATATTVFWVDRYDLNSIPIAAPTQPKHLGDVSYGIASLGGGNLTVAGTRVYFEGDSIRWISTDGSSCGTVVQADFPNDANDYGLDGTYAYVANAKQLARIPLN